MSNRGKSLKETRGCQLESDSALEVPVTFLRMELSGYMRAGVPSFRAWKGIMESRVVDRFRIAIRSCNPRERGNLMNSIVYIVGLVVIIIAILSFFGLR